MALTESSSDSLESTHILLLDDDDVFVDDVENVSRNIAIRPIEWSRATTIQEALSLLANSVPDIAVVDIGLIGENGLDFVRAVRERSFVFPIILISQNELNELVYNGSEISMPSLIQLGANEFQTKTQISISQKNFINFVVSTADGFGRLYEQADKPDREFHSALSKQAIVDLSRALDLFRKLSASESVRVKKDPLASDDWASREIVILVDGVIARERMRLEYAVNLTISERQQRRV